MEKLNNINLAIIGIGRMGITHYSIINSHPKVTIKAVADTSSLILSFLKKYIGGLHTYTDVNTLYENEILDAVIVCTPPIFHYPVIMQAAEKGIHVFSEKPFTTKEEQAAELMMLFEKKSLVNQVGYVNRFNDVFQTVKSYLDDEIIGRIIRFKSETSFPLM